MKYVKKAIPIDAWHMTYDNWEYDGYPDFIQEQLKKKDSNLYFTIDVEKRIISATVKTLEGTMTATEGSYIIKGIHGEFYPCKEDIFLESYEEYHGI